MSGKQLPVHNTQSSRKCGSCTACCVTLEIPELSKGRNTECIHLKKRRGCGIYNERPSACRGFSCLWADRYLPSSLRPDRSGLMAYFVEHAELGPSILVTELRPGVISRSSQTKNKILSLSRQQNKPVIFVEHESEQASIAIPE